MPHLTDHNGTMIQCSKWGDEWIATANIPSEPQSGKTPEEAINNMKEYLDKMHKDA